MPKIPQSSASLEAHLKEQISWLKRSAAAFDRGDNSEAKRIAGALRTLVHQTSSSHALLVQLGLDQRSYLNSATPLDHANQIEQCGLVGFGAKRGKPVFFPFLDDRPLEFVSLQDWWTQEVLWDRVSSPFSRRDLVLRMANQDGGSHVDPQIDEAYERVRNGGLGISINGTAARSPALSAVRQMGHEMIKSLDPSYSKRPNGKSLGTVYAAPRLAKHPGPPAPPVPADYGAAPASAPCSCNSGVPFSACHAKGYVSPKTEKSLLESAPFKMPPSPESI